MLIDKELIDKAKTKLGEDAALIIAETLKVEDFDEVSLKCKCCFHHEETPSMIYNKKTNQFHCFGCGRNTDIIDAFMIGEKKTYIEAVQKLFELTNIKYAFGEHKVKSRSSYRYPDPKYADNKEEVYKYWEKRGISKETIDYLNMQQDEQGNTLFQYYSENDVLTMVKVRPSRKFIKGKDKAKTWCLANSDTANILYNMNKINIDSPLLITTGEGDCAACIESGFTNTVSIPLGDSNTHWVEDNLEWLDQFKEIIIAHDNDESGIKYLKNIVPRLGSWRCKIVNLPSTVEVNGALRAVKDINEYLVYCGKDAVLKIILEAKDSPVPSLVDITTLEDADMSDVDGINFGLRDIDREIMRLFFGSFTVLSGYPGSGKTSIINQVIANSLEQDYPAWIFSPELPNKSTKNWLYTLLAGKRHLNEYDSKFDGKYYKIKPEAIKQMDEHYKGQVMLYRDDWDNDVEKIKESMKDAVLKFSCKTFIVDNLMMVNLGCTESNINQKQTDFVNFLIKFASKYQVCVILVAHPNKTADASQNIGMYSISGTSNIANLAHRTLSLRRVTKKEKASNTEFSKYNIVFSLSKDRLTGKSDFETGLYYDYASRRFFTDYEEYAKQYKWDNNKYDDALPCPVCLQNEAEVFGEVKR